METLSRTSQNLTSHGHSVYLDTRVLNGDSNRPRRPYYTRSERAQFKRDTKQTLQILSTQSGKHELADKVRRCYANVSAVTCENKHLAQLVPDYTCGFRLCPDCARRKASKYIRQYLPAVLAYVAYSGATPCTLTVTQKPRPEPLHASIKRLKANYRKFYQSKLFKTLFAGGDWHIEWTINDEGLFHVHMHCTVFRFSKDKMSDENLQSLKDLWLKITGDAHVLHLGWIDSNQEGGFERAMFEVMKYPMKPADVSRLSPQMFCEIAELGREHLSGTFGAYRKFCSTYEPVDGDGHSLATSPEHTIGEPCSTCGKPLYEVRLKGADLPAFLAQGDISRAIE